MKQRFARLLGGKLLKGRTRIELCIVIIVIAITVFFHNVHIAHAVEGDTINFPDANLKKALMDIGTDKSGDGNISEGEMAALTGTLDFSGKDISNISGLQYAVNIDGLNLYATDVRDITTISGLTNLTYLNLGYDYLEDDSLPKLEALTSIEYLYLSINNFSDISPLHNMINLKELDISRNKITDIDALANMYRLETLNLEYCKVTDISVLADKTSLSTINVASNYLNPNDITGDMGILENIENVSGLNDQFKIEITYNGGLYGTPERSIDSVYHGDIVIMPTLAFDTSFIVDGWDTNGDGIADVAAGAEYCAEPPLVASRYNVTYNAVYHRDYTWSSGSGTPDDPYMISTPDQVNEIRYFPNACYLLTNNIDMSAVTSEGGELYCEGAGWNPIDKINGILDGNGYQINGLSSSRDKTSFIITVGESGEIKNLTLNDIYMEGEDCASGLCHENNGLITNCNISGYIAQTTSDISTYNGGISGKNYGTISYCKVSGTVTALDYSYLVGGITAYNEGLIEYCVNASAVKAEGTCGGIADRNKATINACYNTGYVGGTTCGGIAGDSRSGSIITDCYNIGSVNGSHGGGIAGDSGGTVSNCYNVGTVQGMGIINDVTYGGTVTNCYAIENASGVIELNSSVSNVESLTNEEMQLQGSFSDFDFNNVWTIAGGSDYPYPKLRQVPMTAPPENTTDFAGGNGLPYNPYRIVTAVHLNNIRNYAWNWFELQNDIDLTEATRTGGAFFNEGYGWTSIGDTNGNFFGVFDGNLHNIIGLHGSGLFNGLKDCSTIKNLGIPRAVIKKSGIICEINYGYIVQCYTSGDVTESGAGLARENRGLISNCYSSANIFGDYVGGLVDSNYGKIEFCYSSGNVSTTVPLNGDLVTIGSTENNCYHVLNAKSASGSEEANPGIELSEQEFRQQDSFDLLNFSSIWTMDGDSDYPYPEIQGLQHIERLDNTTEFAGGNGMWYDPYIISTAENLNNIKNFCMSNYSLQSDIDLGGADWESFDFYGNFEGNNHVISNGKIIACDWREGFFGSVNDSTISNLGIEDFCIVSDIGSGPKYVGLFAGESYYSRIINCYATGSINCVRGRTVGGFTGCSNGKIFDCYADASIIGEDRVGGFTGYLWDVTSHDVSEEYCEVRNCYFTGEVKGVYSVGGFTGVSSGKVYVLDCYTDGEVNGAGFVGEFIGAEDPECTYNNCYWYSSTNSDSIGAGADIIGAGSTVLISKINIPEIDNVDINTPVAPSELTTNFELYGDPVSISFIQTQDSSIAIIASEQLKGVSLGSTEVDLLFTYTDERVVRISGYNISISGTPLISVIGVSLGRLEPYVDINDIITLTVTVSPEDATNKKVLWSSADDTVAIVEDGVVTAIGSGTTTITVVTEDGDFSDTCTVIVIQPVTSVNINDDTKTMIAGEMVTLTATVSPSDATYPTVTWSSSDTTVATVDGNGKVTAISAGTAIITVKTDDGGYTGTCTVTVQSAQYTVSAYASSASYGSVSGGGTYDNGETVTLTAIPNAGYRFVCWKNGSTQVSKNPVYTFAASDDSTVTAEFALIGTPAPSASSAGYTSAKVTWTAVTGAAGYEVWRGDSASGTYTKLGTAAGTSYTHSGLMTGRTYYYKIKAYCTASATTTYGNLSAYASATPVPSAATATATMASYNSIKVSWGSVSGASGYQLYRATSQNGKYSLIKTTTSKSYTNKSLKTGTTYYYKVRSYKTVSGKKVYGDYSTVVSATPVLANVSGAAAKAYSATGVKISWDKVSGRSGYEIWRSASPNSGFALIKSTKSTSYKNTKLTPSVTGKPVTYYYKVRAYRTVSGKRVYSAFTAVTSASPAFADVASAAAAATSPTTVKVSWGKVSGRSGYEIWRSTSPDNGFALIKSTKSTYYKNTKRTPFTTYYYKVRAYVKVGSKKVYSAFTTAASARPTFANVSGVSAVRSSATKIKISWSKVSGCSGYEVWRSTASDGAYTLVKSTTSRSYTNTKLITGTAYYYKVRAYVKVNGVRIYSAYSGPVSATP